MSSSRANELTLRLELDLNVFQSSSVQCSLHHTGKEGKELEEVTPGSLEPHFGGPRTGIACTVPLRVAHAALSCTF